MAQAFFKRTPRGFTLIELMIVIAIIGILAAIAIPRFTAYKVKAYNAQSKYDLKNAYTAAQAYFTENPGGTFDTASLTASGFQPSPGVVLTIISGASTTLVLTASNTYAGSAAISYTLNAAGAVTP